MPRPAVPLICLLVVCSSVAPAAARAPRPYTLSHGHAVRRFSVSYAGSGKFATVYRSTPPNPGGNPDHNYASDSSNQAWRLTFVRKLALRACKTARRSCPGGSVTLERARGWTEVTGKVDHTHIDGLYAFDDRSVRCSVAAGTPSGARTVAGVQFRWALKRRALEIVAFDPVQRALTLLPSQCPGQGDSVDGLYDEYFGPGFSFATGYGPDRWFTSAKVIVPLRVLRRARVIRVSIADTRAGTPPPGCEVPDPAYEQCSTGGSWSGILTLRARG